MIPSIPDTVTLPFWLWLASTVSYFIAVALLLRGLAQAGDGLQQREALMEHYKEIASTVYLLELMTMRGSSVSLTWGEDTSLWECSWRIGGERITGAGPTVKEAVETVGKGEEQS